MSGPNDSRRAIVAAFLANFGIAVAKLVGFAFTGAASLLAEAGHSIADTANQGLLLLGRRKANQAPDDRRPFGYGRERFFWSFVVAMVLFTAGALFALYEGVEKLRAPHEIESPKWAIAILVVALLLEGGSLRTAVVESAKVKGTQSWWSFVQTTTAPELPVVLLEDIGALVGLVFALFGVGMAALTGEPRWDALGSLAIGSLLAVIAFVLAAKMKSLLIGEPATSDQVTRIGQALVATPGIDKVIHLRTEHVGPDDLLVVTKVSLEPAVTMGEVARIIDAAEVAVRGAVAEARLIFIEPDIARGAE